MTNITCVVDSSIYASIIVRDEHYERARNFITSHKRSELATVATAFAEVANALWKHTYLLQRVPEKSYQILKNMVVPLIETSTGWICEPTRLLSQALDVAAKYRITVYDALFVALALRAKAKLASFDHKLRESPRSQRSRHSLCVVEYPANVDYESHKFLMEIFTPRTPSRLYSL